MRYQLMCKDEVRAEFSLIHECDYDTADICILGELPVGCIANKLFDWLNGRHASKHRHHLTRYLNNIGCNNIEGFLSLTHGISINDCYWVRKIDENIKWENVSPYSNDFDEIVQHLAFDGKGMFGEQLSSTSPEFGTSGAFDKCWVREDDGICLIKRGSDIASNSGLEPYCEVLASKVFRQMKAGIPYRLIHYRGKVASKCRIFNDESRSFVPYGSLPNASSALPSTLKFFDSLGYSTFRRIIVCDALTLNSDRHMGNYGVFCDPMSNQVIAPAPGFDYNLSMLPYLTRDDFAELAYRISSYTPKIGSDFISAAKSVLTADIRKDLANLRGIELSLDFYDEHFTEERAKWMTAIVNEQIDNILYDRQPVYPVIKVDGLSNTMKYRLKLKLTEDEWVEQVPTLMKLFGISHMEELEREIVKLL